MIMLGILFLGFLMIEYCLIYNIDKMRLNGIVVVTFTGASQKIRIMFKIQILFLFLQ